jgi:hypothetical protein
MDYVGAKSVILSRGILMLVRFFASALDASDFHRLQCPVIRRRQVVADNHDSRPGTSLRVVGFSHTVITEHKQ